MKITLLVLSCAISGILTARPKNFGAPSPLSIRDAPFFVTIFHNCEPQCGGALIHVTHIITAAHCVVDVGSKKYSNLTVESGTDRFHEGGTCHEVEDVAVAPGYPNGNLLNDLAIITLSQRVRFENFVDLPIIGLPTAEPISGEVAKVIGFEYMSPPEGAPLRERHAVIKSAEECGAFELFKYFDLSSKFCVVDDVFVDLFPGYGDGVPLVSNGKLLGIGSVQSSTSDLMHYYTNVHQFVPFIKSVIGESSKDSSGNL